MAGNRTGAYFAFFAACVHSKFFPAVLRQFLGIFDHARYMHVHGRAHQVEAVGRARFIARRKNEPPAATSNYSNIKSQLSSGQNAAVARIQEHI